MLFVTATSIVLSQRCGTSYAEQKERQRERKITIRQRARESRIGCYLNVEERETVRRSFLYVGGRFGNLWRCSRRKDSNVIYLKTLAASIHIFVIFGVSFINEWRILILEFSMS